MAKLKLHARIHEYIVARSSDELSDIKIIAEPGCFNLTQEASVGTDEKYLFTLLKYYYTW